MSQFQGNWRQLLLRKSAEGLPLEVVDLPEFHSTEEAHDFGRTASPEDARKLKERRAYYIQAGKASQAKGDFNAASRYYTYAQFDREALEEAPTALQLGETL